MNKASSDYSRRDFVSGIRENVEDDMGIKGIIFDLDGTLIDSVGVWEKVDEVFFSKRGHEVPNNYGDAISVCGFYQAAVYTAELLNSPESPGEIIAEWNKIALDLYKNSILLMPYALEYLEHCKRAGLKMSVATASPPEVAEAVLRSNGIFDYFDAVLSVGGEIRGKDHSDIYIEAAKSMELRPKDCIVFEDLVKAAASAKASGAYVYGIFDKGADKLGKAADAYIENFSQAPRFYEIKAELTE